MIEFNVLGIRITVSIWFCIIVSLMCCVDKNAIIYGIISAAIHEAGHITAMMILSQKPSEISFFAGHISIVPKIIEDIYKEFLIFCAGPLFNLIAAFVCLFINAKTTLLYSNFALFTFNMIPISGFDAGDMLYLILTLKTDYTTASSVCEAVSFLFCVVLAAVSIVLFIFNGNVYFAIAAGFSVFCAFNF